MDSMVHRRVAIGMAWLDSAHPGWRERVDPATVNICSTRFCVLGQMFAAHPDVITAREVAGAYDWEVWGVLTRLAGIDWDTAKTLGLDCTQLYSCEDLMRAWREALAPSTV